MNRRPPVQSRAGFSMLEIILVLLLIGIIGVFTAPLLGKIMVATVSGVADQQTAEEAYWATSRLTSILGVAIKGTTVSGNQVNGKFVTLDLASGRYDTNDFTIAFSDSKNQVTYNGDLLWAQVNSFEMSLEDNLFHVDVQLVDGKHPEISLDVYARNMK